MARCKVPEMKGALHEPLAKHGSDRVKSVVANAACNHSLEQYDSIWLSLSQGSCCQPARRHIRLVVLQEMVVANSVRNHAFCSV